MIIGENRTFDHVFATYKPKKGESVSNLLSKGIVNEDGTPGPNVSLGAQSSAIDSFADGFQMSPSGNTPYSVLPPVLPGGGLPPFPDVATRPGRSLANGANDLPWRVCPAWRNNLGAGGPRSFPPSVVVASKGPRL